jgi:hypothetical protein
MSDHGPIHSLRPGDLWDQTAPPWDPDRSVRYLCVTHLVGPSVVRGWFVGGSDPPKLIECAGDIFEKHAVKIDPNEQMTAPGWKPGRAVGDDPVPMTDDDLRRVESRQRIDGEVAARDPSELPPSHMMQGHLARQIEDGRRLLQEVRRIQAELSAAFTESAMWRDLATRSSQENTALRDEAIDIRGAVPRARAAYADIAEAVAERATSPLVAEAARTIAAQIRAQEKT